MRTNLLEELQDPLEQRRNVPVVNPHFFTRNPATKDIHVQPRTKQYGLVFDKRVVDPATFKSYPYGYGSLQDRDDVRNAELLVSLMEEEDEDY